MPRRPPLLPRTSGVLEKKTLEKREMITEMNALNKKMVEDTLKQIRSRKEKFDWKEQYYKGNENIIEYDSQIDEIAFYVAMAHYKMLAMNEVKGKILMELDKNVSPEELAYRNLKEKYEGFKVQVLKKSKNIKISGKKEFESFFFMDDFLVNKEKSELTVDEIAEYSLNIKNALSTDIIVETPEHEMKFMQKICTIESETMVKVTAKNNMKILDLCSRAVETRDPKIEKEIDTIINEFKVQLLEFCEQIYEEYNEEVSCVKYYINLMKKEVM